MNEKKPIKNYIKTFENLDKDNINTLKKIFDEEIIFRDPFNYTKGILNTISIFERMFISLKDPVFSVKEYGVSYTNKKKYFLSWELSGKFKNSSKSVKIEGLSEVTFNLDGKAISHVDYWDSLSQLLIKLPKIGLVINYFKKKFL